MPAKKVAKKKVAKKSVAKKPAAKKATPKKSAPPKTKAKTRPAPDPKPVAKPIVRPIPLPIEEPDDFDYDGPMKECEHCDGIGKCTAGEPYDKGHHQLFGAKLMLTSCMTCLEASGEHKNSKKLVSCSFCKSTGQVKA
jgi:hypothetical protein